MTAAKPQRKMNLTPSMTEEGVLEEPRCDLCGADQPVLLFEQRDIRFGFEEPTFGIVRCTVCDLIYLSPRPTRRAIGRHYPRAYYEFHHPPRARGQLGMWVRRLKAAIRSGVLQEFYGYPEGRGVSRASRAWRLFWKALVYGEHLRLKFRGKTGTILPFVAGGRLLDVGCGSGEFLQRHVALGWEGWGVEIDSEAARYAREQRGLRVLDGDLPGARLSSGTFDMVVFTHSLEHMFSPTATLQEVNRVLRPGGHLFLALPNAASAEARLFGRWWFGWEVPRHLYHFTPRTVSRCLWRTGFRINRMGWDPSPLTFLESLRYVWRYTRGRELTKSKALSWMARTLMFCFRQLQLGSVMYVHAEKVRELSAPTGQ